MGPFRWHFPLLFLISLSGTPFFIDKKVQGTSMFAGGTFPCRYPHEYGKRVAKSYLKQSADDIAKVARPAGLKVRVHKDRLGSGKEVL